MLKPGGNVMPACLRQAGREQAAEVVGPHREQAAEEGGPGRQADSAADAYRDNPCWHSRLAGMYKINHWIPAYAGMTVGVEVKKFARHGSQRR